VVTKLAIVTGSRADAGLLSPVIREIRARSNWEVTVVAAGDHQLSATDPATLSGSLGFSVDVMLPSLKLTNGVVDVPGSLAEGITSFSNLFGKLRPDLVVLLGDRFEIFAAAVAAHVSNLAVAHIHGGEATVGSMDDAFRHSITKMSSLHFVAHDEYRRRVIQLGESPLMVHVVGALGIDTIRQTKFLDPPALAELVGLDESEPYVVLSVHPESNSSQPERPAAVAISSLEQLPNVQVVASLSNSDVGTSEVNRLIERFASSRPNVRLTPSLGSTVYLSLVKRAVAIVGNSSSGILEAPFLGVPTFNVGGRQQGRVKPPSVVDVQFDAHLLVALIGKAHREYLPPDNQNRDLTFGDGFAAARIVDSLLKTKFPISVRKKFYDL